MDAKVIHRGDTLEAEQFRAMLDSPGFARLRERIAVELARARTDIETATEPHDIYRRQGGVHALRLMLSLPDQILSEMRKK